MKQLITYISEKLHLDKDTKIEADYHYHYYPENRVELKSLVNKLIKERGNDADLNDIDVSKVTNMQNMFESSKFNGDISEWNVSNVKDMCGMFYKSKFNRDISEWNVSNVKDMSFMFKDSPLEKNPPKWYHE